MDRPQSPTPEGAVPASQVSLRELMEPAPVVSSNEPMSVLARRLAEASVHGLIVVDDQKKPVGSVTAEQLIHEAEGHGRQTFFGEKVRDVMSTRIVSVDGATTVEEAASLFGTGIPWLVVCEKGAVAGIVRASALLSYLWQQRTTS